jgi:ferredoxin-type protein NapH
MFLNREILFSVLILALIPVIIAFAAGKVFCSWICPYNLIAEWADRLRRRIRPSSVRTQNSNPRTWIYWGILAGIIVIVILTGIPLITFISMPGLISAQTSDLILAGELGIELALVPAVLIIEVFVLERFWCRFACPVGSTLAIFRTPRTLSVSYEGKKCQFQCSGSASRSVCNEACPVQLNPKRSGLYPYCYNCGACIEACQTHGGSALQFRFGSRTVKHIENKS